MLNKNTTGDAGPLAGSHETPKSNLQPPADKVIKSQVDQDRLDLYGDCLMATSKIIIKRGMGSGAVAIVLGHIVRLFKYENSKTPKSDLEGETHAQRFDRLVKKATGFAKSTTSRYAQLAEVFLSKKQDVQQLIEDSVNGLDINDASMAKIAEKIGEDRDVTKLYRLYGILPEIEDKKTVSQGRSLKDVFSDDLEKLSAKFGAMAIAEEYDPNVIVSIQEDLAGVKLKSETALGAEEVKARAAKESRGRVVTKKKSKRILDVEKAMELHAEEMKETVPTRGKEAGQAAV